jgi:PilZ domain
MRETETFSTMDTPDVPDDIIEKRRFPRTREYGAQQLDVSFAAEQGQRETVTARLWDFGEGGLGMESPRSFHPGEEIQIAGELHGPDYSMRMRARARVAYSRAVDAEFFRVGVAFVEVSYRRIPAASD